MKSLGIRGRILLAALAPATLVALLVSGMLVATQVEQSRVDQHRRLSAVARQLSSMAEFSIFSGDTGGLQRLLDSALTEPDVVGAAFLDPDGKVLASTLPTRELPPPEEVYAGFAPPLNFQHIEHWHVQPIRPVNYGEADLFSDPAKPAPPLLGQLLIKVSTASLRDEIRNYAFKAAAISALILLFGVLLALALSRGLIRTLTDVGRAVAGISRGHNDLRVAPAGTDELGQLAAGINEMASAVAQTQDELALRIAKATATLRRERDAAEAAVQARSRFFAAVSHDLRQPLQALGLFVGRLECDAGTSPPSLLLPRVHKIAQTVQGLQELLDTLLDYSRLDGKVYQVARRPVRASAVINHLLDDFAEAALAKHLTLRTRVTDCWLMTDPGLLHRILLNLLSNAVRHTQSGGILVACRVGATEARIEVWDTGPGIPAAAHDVIFEELVQLDNPERDPAKGLGLGLAIVRRMADLLEHPVHLCSRVGHGSRFGITLPLAPAPSTDEELDAPADDPLNGARILLMSESPTEQVELFAQLAGWGCAVSFVSTARAAAEWVASHGSPDLLVWNAADGAAGAAMACTLIDGLGSADHPLPSLIIASGPVPAQAAHPGAAPRLL